MVRAGAVQGAFLAKEALQGKCDRQRRQERQCGPRAQQRVDHDVLTGDTGVERDCTGNLRSNDWTEMLRPAMEILECRVEAFPPDTAGNRELQQVLEQENGV